jgi:molybdopterin-dependent oxidoreductase alpha subunit
MHKKIVGGGFKKVLYTLNTVRRIGVKDAAKALAAHNACKACGLGMGGQRGGMINELDEFPSVCNKSVQAQSTDIQGPIPLPVFDHTIADFKELSSHEIEHLGRLGNPLHKATDSNKFEPISWDEAIARTVERFSASTPERSFFYASGRSSNEAAFVLQLMARLYGSTNINNCSYYCHQASGDGLATTIGTGTSTVELADLGRSDLIFVLGANPSSNHPRFIHQLKNCRERGGHVVVINPAKEPGLVKFAVPKSPKSLLMGGNDIASEYLQPKIATDVAVFKGIAKSIIENKQHNADFIAQYTRNFDAYLTDIEKTSWYEIEAITGLTQAEIETVADVYAKSENAVFAWGMGMTHHLHGVDNVEAIANLAMLRGMLGKPGAGLLPLRGHSNIQGVGTVGVKPVLAEDVFTAIESELSITLPRNKGMDTMACLQAAERGDIDNALMLGGNLYAASPDSHWAEKSLDNIPFKVFLTTTLNQGHVHGCDNSESIIFPVLARDEEHDPTSQESMFNYVRLSDGGIDRLDNLRSEVDILSDIGMGVVDKNQFDFSTFKKHTTIRHAIAKSIPGMQDLADIDVAKKEFFIRNRIKHTPEFNMPDNRAVFIVNPHDHPEERKAKHAFTLMSIRSEGQFNSIIYEERDSYRNTMHRHSVLMNEDDMLTLGIKEKDKVTLRSDTGEMRNLDVVAFDLPRGNIAAYYPEANVLVGQTVDQRSRTPAFKSVPVSVEVHSLIGSLY